jgi:hypothetical protein
MAARPTNPDDRDDREPVARWENEGGAPDERDAQPRPAPTVTAPEDGQATTRL